MGSCRDEKSFVLAVYSRILGKMINGVLKEENLNIMKASPSLAFSSLIIILLGFAVVACQPSSTSSEEEIDMTITEAPYTESVHLDVGAIPTENAMVYFDGSREMLDSNWTYWESPRLAAELPIKWAIEADPKGEGTAVNTNDAAAAGGVYGAADIVTKQKFKDVRVHVEFLIKEEGGNSGVYLQNRFEIQVLDGDSTVHGLATVINETASPYYAYRGLGEWNAYDIMFRAARFEGEKMVEKPMVTVYFNGRKVHQNVSINQVWGGVNSGLDGGNDDGKGITDTPGGLKLQAEGHNVLYKNIWIEELNLTEANTDF